MWRHPLAYVGITNPPNERLWHQTINYQVTKCDVIIAKRKKKTCRSALFFGLSLNCTRPWTKSSPSLPWPAFFCHFFCPWSAHTSIDADKKEKHALLNWSFCGYAVLISKIYESYCILIYTHANTGCLPLDTCRMCECVCVCVLLRRRGLKTNSLKKKLIKVTEKKCKGSRTTQESVCMSLLTWPTF